MGYTSPTTGTRAAFLDRDGVLIRSDVIQGKPFAIRRLEDLSFFPDVKPSIAQLQKHGFKIVVVTNQPDVGNGIVDRSVVEQMNARIQSELSVDVVKTCYHAQTDGCACRKPKPGMILSAAAELQINLSASFMVGDRRSDIEAGRAAGCRTVFIDRNYTERKPEAPDFTASSLSDAVTQILGADTAATNRKSHHA